MTDTSEYKERMIKERFERLEAEIYYLQKRAERLEAEIARIQAGGE